MDTEHMIPLSKLHASEAQTLRAMALVKDMSKVLRDSAIDGVTPLLERAEAVEVGLDVCNQIQEWIESTYWFLEVALLPPDCIQTLGARNEMDATLLFALRQLEIDMATVQEIVQ